jgi:pyruvate kinase
MADGMRRTKIVCTLGPATSTPERIRELVEAGMNVARLNCSHGNWAEKAEWIAAIRKLEPRLGPVAILADLQGPKFRLGELPNGRLMLHVGEEITLGRDGELPIEQDEVSAALQPGDRVLLGDGEVEIGILTRAGALAKGRVRNGGVVGSRKGITVFGKSFTVPAFGERDQADAREAIRLGCDLIALSYVRSPAEMEELKAFIQRETPPGQRPALRCAKLETREAVDNAAGVIRASDLVMVARGDMGLQMDLEEVPLAQKAIIDEANHQAKPVITATQMLETMMSRPRPTRAEASDVYNAILDGTDAVMLSGETAAGEYPVECVRTMDRIARRAEGHYRWDRVAERYQAQSPEEVSDTEALAFAVRELAYRCDAAAILALTTGGGTAQNVSKFRPQAPILASTTNATTLRQLGAVWGVQAMLFEGEETVERAAAMWKNAGRLRTNDKVVAVAGLPAGQSGSTNYVRLYRVP